MKLSTPWYPAAGTYCTTPPFNTAVPFAGVPTALTRNSAGPRSGSRSFPSTLTLTGMPNGVHTASPTATGALFAGAISGPAAPTVRASKGTTSRGWRGLLQWKVIWALPPPWKYSSFTSTGCPATSGRVV